jgi:hypothetical protein
MLKPQKVPMTVNDKIGPISTATFWELPPAKTLPYRKKNPNGMTKLKKMNALFRKVMRMRTAASVSIVLNRAVSFPSVR